MDELTGAAIRGPVTVLAIDLAADVGSRDDTLLGGSITIGGLEASPDRSGGSWSALPAAGGSPGRWTRDTGGGPEPFTPAAAGLLDLDAAGPARRVAVRQSFAPAEAAPIPALASPGFLERTSAKLGDRVEASLFGVPMMVDLVGAVDSFPTLSPSEPFLVADGLALDLARFGAGVTLGQTDEWWLATEPGASASVGAAVSGSPFLPARVVDRTAIQAGLAGDPLGLGVIGILGLGSAAALLFAAVGFLVSVTVSTQERMGEFALLKALGLAPRQLSIWLSTESTALLVVGLTMGVLLGLVLAWLALPFATLTGTGEPPVPAPTVVVPPGALVPVVLMGLILVAATALLVRRQLPAARTSAVLRAPDE